MTAHLQDLESLEVHLPDRPGALADLAQALGRAGVSLDGGGGFTHDGQALAHYLIDNGPLALQAANEAQLGPATVRDVTMTRLHQETPGQGTTRRTGRAVG
ncbi:ACT domain-containing protein [Streptomyces sp. NPDC001739]